MCSLIVRSSGAEGRKLSDDGDGCWASWLAGLAGWLAGLVGWLAGWQYKHTTIQLNNNYTTNLSVKNHYYYYYYYYYE